MFITAKEATQLCRGEWRSNYGSAPCPICQPEGRPDQRALSIANKGGRLLVHCFKSNCPFDELLAAISDGSPKRCAPLTARRIRNNSVANNAQRAASIWKQSLPARGTLVEIYLRSRGLTTEIPASIRFLPNCYHTPSQTYHPAMVASLSTGGIHRTYLTQTGQKLSSHSKMMLGPCKGSAVERSNRAGALVVCEGIETGLSLLSHTFRSKGRVLAVLSTSGMKSLVLPPASAKLIIATDGDMAGRNAGNALALRAYRLGWSVDLLPAPDGKDWNDVFQPKETS